MGPTYGRSDAQRLCNIPADITDIQPTGIVDPHIGGGKVGTVSVDCRFLHEHSKWGQLEYSHGTLSAGIIHMGISFKNLHDCVLKSAVVRVILDGEHKILQRYQKVVSQASGSLKNAVEVKQLGPVSLIGTPFGVASKSVFAVSPQFDAGGLGSLSGIDVSKEKEWRQLTRWVFEGSAWPHKSLSATAKKSGTVNSVEWTLKENVQEGQPSHGNYFRTAFVFANTGQPFLMRVEIDGELVKKRDRFRESIKRGIHEVKEKSFMFGSSSSLEKAPTALVRGFNGEKQRLNKFAERLDEDMNKINGAVDYNRRPQSQVSSPEHPGAGEVEEGIEPVGEENTGDDGAQAEPEAAPQNFADMVKFQSKADSGYEHRYGGDPDTRAPPEPAGKIMRRQTKEDEEKLILLQLFVHVWREFLGRIRQILVTG